MPTTIGTQWTPLFKARSVNETSANFVAKVPMATEPLDDVPGVTTATSQASINMRHGATILQNGLMILPYGVGADNTTFSMRFIGWRRLGASNDPTRYIWVGPIMLGEFNCIIDSDLVGLAGRLIVATEFFCDTITLQGTSGNANISHEILSPADGVTMAHVILDTKACDRVEPSFKVGTATSANALIAMF